MKILAVGLHQYSVEHLQCRYMVDDAEDGEDALSILRYNNYDACVAQMGFTGKMFPFHVRSSGSKIPLIMLTSKKHDVRAGLVNNGADLCLKSPGWHDELIAGINACIRRSKGYTSKILDFGGLVVDIDEQHITVSGNEVHLTKSEYTVLEAIAINSPTLASKNYLYDCLYLVDSPVNRKIVDVFVCKLRRKIKEHTDFEHISTSWGRGYTLCSSKEEIND